MCVCVCVWGGGVACQPAVSLTGVPRFEEPDLELKLSSEISASLHSLKVGYRFPVTDCASHVFL